VPFSINEAETKGKTSKKQKDTRKRKRREEEGERVARYHQYGAREEGARQK
jgi:hypothetical protein